jgi:threonine dehydrogenase-like Zn-dependent dehydrogenase
MVSLSGADGWDVVIECAGGPQALETALTIVRPAGHVAIIGASSDDQVLSVPANIFYKKDLRVDGILSYTPESFRHALDLLASGKLRLKDLITHRLPFERFTDAVELLAARAEPLGKVMVGNFD